MGFGDLKELNQIDEQIAQIQKGIPNENITDATDKHVENKRLLSRDAHGDFFYDGKKISMDRNTIYCRMLNALYSGADQDGFSSYEDIEKRLVDSGEEEIFDEGKRNKRITNAVSKTQGLFRFAKISGNSFENELPNGGKLIDIVKGKGLRLNNSII